MSKIAIQRKSSSKQIKNEHSALSLYTWITVEPPVKTTAIMTLCQTGLKPAKNAETKHFPNHFPPEHEKRWSCKNYSWRSMASSSHRKRAKNRKPRSCLGELTKSKNNKQTAVINITRQRMLFITAVCLLFLLKLKWPKNECLRWS